MEYVSRSQGSIQVGMWQGGSAINYTTIDKALISMNTGYYTLRATATATGWAEIRIRMDNETNGVAYIDDISVRYSTPMFTDASSYGINGHFAFGQGNQLNGSPSFNGFDGGRCGDISTETVRFSNGDSVSGMATPQNCLLSADTNISDLNLNSAITLEAWGTMRSSVPANNYTSLWAVKEGGWGIYPEHVDGSDFTINGKIKVANSGSWQYLSAGGEYKGNINQWYHIVMTYSQANSKLIGYVNGNKFSEQTTPGGIINDVHDIDFDFAVLLAGMVDGVAIYNVAISSREVTAHYWRHRYAELTPTCSIGSEQPKYYSGGSYSSSVIFTGVDSSSMTLVWFSSTAVSGGQINLQVRASDTQFYEADGTPSWVDVNGSSDTMITAIGKYMQYRSTFSTVYSTVTAVLNDVTIEYSTVTVPSAPTGLYATDVTSGSVTWNWTDTNSAGNSKQEEGYKIYSSTGGSYTGLTALDITSKNEINLSSNTLYSRYVQAYNSAGSSNSVVVSTYTLASPPNNLILNILYRSSATISWDDVGATRYLIERSLGVSSPDSWQTLNSTPTPGYTDTGLSGETTYWYRVKSYNADDLINETASNIISTITVTAAPTGFKASQISTGSIMWSWEDNSNAEIGYRVYATTDGIIKTLSTAGATYWLETNMQPNTQYSRYAVAYNASESDISNVISSYTLANSPTNLVMNTLYRSSATISWDNVGATRYAIERSTGDVTAVNWQYIIQWADNIIATNYTDTLLSSETTYWYRVKSYNTEGIMNITSSNIISTITVPSAVSGFTCNLVSTSSIMWSWSDNSNIEDGYYIKTSTSGIIKTFVSETTYWQETGLQPNTQYSRYAVAYNANESEASTTISTYTLATSPISLTASVINMSSATLSWSGNGTRYAIERSANGTSWSYIKQWADAVTDTIYTDTGLTVNATYYYRIRAYNGDGIITDSSSVVTIKTLKKEQKPAVPGSIVIYLINGQTSAVPGDTIRLTATAEAGSSIYSMIVKDQNGNILSQWIEPAGEVAQPPISLLNVEISDSGEIIANILLGDIASKYPMVNGIKVEVTVEDQYDNISEPGSSNLINVSFGENKITLYNNLFNPKTNVTTLRYDLIQSGNVKIDVYTLNGEKVKTLINENKDTGVYWATWDGKDTDGDYVASGIYLVHIKGPDSYSETKKVCVIK